MDEDKTVEQLVAVFSQAIKLLQNRGLAELAISANAMDYLMDHALLLGVEGTANVLMVLAINHGGEATDEQVAQALSCCLEAQHLFDHSN